MRGVGQVVRTERDGLTLQFVGGTSEKLEVACRHFHIAASLTERLAVVERLETGQLLRVGPDRSRDPEQDAPAVRRLGPRPGLTGAIGRLHRLVDQLGGAAGDLGQGQACGRVEGGEDLAVSGDEVTVDERLVAGAHMLSSFFRFLAGLA